MSVNKVILLGNVGKDPEVRHLEGGGVVANFTLATSERFRDKSGLPQERTEWHNIVCWARLLLPLIFPSIRVFSNESALHIKWPKYGSFSFSISTSNAYSGLISFRIDWFDLIAVQGILKSLLQHHTLEASILWCLRVYTHKN